MVSILIGLVILAALVTLFVNTSGSNREMARANSVIENGRFAIKVLENDLVHAGFWGTFVPMFDDQTATDGTPPMRRPRCRIRAWPTTCELERGVHDEPDRHSACRSTTTPRSAELGTCVTDRHHRRLPGQYRRARRAPRGAPACPARAAIARPTSRASSTSSPALRRPMPAARYVLDTAGFTR